jgi:hypothetical protein
MLSLGRLIGTASFPGHEILAQQEDFTFCERASFNSVGSPNMTVLGRTIPKSFAFLIPIPLT